MELVKTKYGYRLTIGGHDMFLTLSDLEELGRLLGLHGVAQGQSAIELPEEVAYVDKGFLLGIGKGERRIVRVPIDKIRAMYSSIHSFNDRYGRQIISKVRKHKGRDELPQVKEYILERIK